MRTVCVQKTGPTTLHVCWHTIWSQIQLHAFIRNKHVCMYSVKDLQIREYMPNQHWVTLQSFVCMLRKRLCVHRKTTGSHKKNLWRTVPDLDKCDKEGNWLLTRVFSSFRAEQLWTEHESSHGHSHSFRYGYMCQILYLRCTWKK
jgi:hypothetical protein